MSSKMQIQNFNQKLIDENVEITIIDYVKLLNYDVYHIDITFVNDLLLLIYEDECCIHHDMLYKYGVLSEHDTHDVKRLFEQYKFIENEQYIINREDVGNKKVGRPQLTYMLHPDAFKKCLISSLKTDKYADYYILLEKCIKHYNEYQLLNMQYKMNNICVDRTIELKDNSKDESFVITLNNIHKNHPYTVIRGQKKNYVKQ